MVTAAHVVEPILPGGRDSYVNLGNFYDSARLEKRRAELLEFTSRYKSAYKNAYKFLAAAGSLNMDSSNTGSKDAISAAVNNCLSLLPVTVDTNAKTRHCFVDTFCSKGYLSLLEDFENWKFFNINASDSAGDIVLKELSRILAENCCGVFCAYSPFSPKMMRHLIIPCHKIIFTLDKVPGYLCAAAISQPKIPPQICDLHDRLIASSTEMMAMAKSAHDTLEEIYNPCVDFTGIYAEARKHIASIL